MTHGWVRGGAWEKAAGRVEEGSTGGRKAAPMWRPRRAGGRRVGAPEEEGGGDWWERFTAGQKVDQGEGNRGR